MRLLKLLYTAIIPFDENSDDVFLIAAIGKDLDSPYAFFKVFSTEGAADCFKEIEEMISPADCLDLKDEIEEFETYPHRVGYFERSTGVEAEALHSMAILTIEEEQGESEGEASHHPDERPPRERMH